MGTSLNGLTPANTYQGLIKFGDNSALTSVLKALSDGNGNDTMLELSTTALQIGGSTGMYWDNTNKMLGVGTNAPIAPLNVYNSSSSVSSIILVEHDTSATIGQINQYRKNGSVNLTSGTEIGRLSFGGYFNSTYSPFSQVCSTIIGYYGGTGTDRVGGLRLTTWNGGGATTRLQVAPDGKVSIGTTGSNAKLQIVGEGSTSATTALLVQNSAGTDVLKVQDNSVVNARGNLNVLHPSIATRSLTLGWGSIFATDTGSELVVGAVFSVPSSPQILLAGNTRSSGANTIQLQASLGVSIAASVTNPNASAQLDISSTTKGFLPPRMTTTEKNAIASPASGLQVYDTTLNQMSYYNGSSWINF